MTILKINEQNKDSTCLKSSQKELKITEFKSQLTSKCTSKFFVVSH